MMTERHVYNFSAGPATLPDEVMCQAQAEFLDFRGAGYGIVEESHRSAAFTEVIETAEADIRELLGIGSEYAVLFLQGGASLQFAMVPMNIMMPGRAAFYADTGTWAGKAVTEAKRFGEVRLMFDGREHDYTRIGNAELWNVDADASYAYVCSNNTIRGTQYKSFPKTGDVPLVADMSSDILSRSIDMPRFAMIFAGAQKNLGPAGVTLVIIRRDLIERTPDTVPTMLRYATHADKGSLFNTPPTFAIYMVGLVAKWLMKQGGLSAVEQANATKAALLYDRIDASSFYAGVAHAADRSPMNVCFRIADTDLEPQFVKEAAETGLIGLKGHRSVGGLRASLYNAMPQQGVDKLVTFMSDFEAAHG